jgi:hypothetical protein
LLSLLLTTLLLRVEVVRVMVVVVVQVAIVNLLLNHLALELPIRLLLEQVATGRLVKAIMVQTQYFQPSLLLVAVGVETHQAERLALLEVLAVVVRLTPVLGVLVIRHQLLQAKVTMEAMQQQTHLLEVAVLEPLEEMQPQVEQEALEVMERHLQLPVHR